MSRSPAPPVAVTRVDPDTLRGRTSLASVDHADRGVLGTELTATPEEWARAMFGDVPTPAEQLIWRGVLGFRLSSGPSPATVGGWRIGGGGSDWIRLETSSSFLGGNMLVETGGGAVAWTTCLRFERPRGRVVWTPVSALHRRLVPGVLRTAAARLTDRGTAH